MTETKTADNQVPFVLIDMGNKFCQAEYKTVYGSLSV